jgi:hypothetical protein
MLLATQAAARRHGWLSIVPQATVKHSARPGAALAGPSVSCFWRASWLLALG